MPSAFAIAFAVALLASPLEGAQSVLSKSGTTDWSHGVAAWKAAIPDADQSLWKSENECDVRALRGSAPLTVLFGISTFWQQIREWQDARGAVEDGASDGHTLEVHVLGAAYPFEGRSDWSLLAARRPAGVSKVRVVLVLGTPWHTDNVPPEAGRKRELLLDMSGPRVHKRSAPKAGRWDNKKEMIVCENDDELKRMDASFHKKDLCKDHGNGLEVVCIEKHYQDVSPTLPRPDVAVMFSPGFPQLARRSWDPVLRDLLDKRVVLMVCDLVSRDGSWKELFGHTSPGGAWSVSNDSDEDGMSWIGMRAYGARRLGALRNPFPLLLKRGEDHLAKNAVLQVFQGYRALHGAEKMPSADVVAKNKAFLSSVNWKQLFKHEDDSGIIKEFRDGLMLPTSLAYDRAMRQYYQPELKELLQSKKVQRSLSNKDKKRLEHLGLMDKPQQRVHWGPEDWVFLIRVLDAGEIF